MKSRAALLQPLRFVLPVLTALCLAPGTLAQTTYVVDDDGGPGVDFTAIQPALAVAGSADVVVVRAGSYAPFSMTAPTRVLGDPGARVSGDSTVVGIGASEWAVVAGLVMDRLSLSGSEGTIVLDGIRWNAASYVLEIDDCADVRGRDLRNHVAPHSISDLVVIRRSAVQLSDCQFRCVDAPPNESGATAVFVQGSSYLHLTDSVIRGGRGGDREPFFGSFARDGGDGICVNDGGDTRIVRSEVRGGGGGFDNIDVLQDGQPGAGLRTCGGSHEVWSSTVAGGNTPGGTYEPGPAFQLGCGAALDVTTALPSMTQVGAGAPSTQVIFEARAEPMSSGRLIFGRFPVRVSVPGSSTPRLASIGRLASLGAMSPAGVLPIQLNIPAWPRGTVVFLQTSSTTGAGTQMSNGVAVVVR